MAKSLYIFVNCERTRERAYSPLGVVHRMFVAFVFR